MFPGWCPHCWGSSHSFQPDVLVQGAGHSLRPCKGCFTHKGLCTGNGACWQRWHSAGGHKGQVGTNPLGGSAPMSLSTCHIQLWDTQGVGVTQVWIQLPPAVQLWPTWPSISPCLAPHGNQTHENMFSG